MQINYGGNDLTKYFKVLDVRRQLLPSRKNYTKEIPSINGEYYSGYKYGVRTIEVDFAIIGESKEEYFAKSRELASMVDVVIPTKLEFSDDPNKYYYAVVDGSIDIDQIMNYGSGKISFVCNDPIAYSKEEKIFTASPDNKVTIDNKGTAFTEPLINVSFGQDAHFLQCTYFTGETVLLGSRPDVDKPSASQSDEVLSESCEVTTNFTSIGNVLDEGRELMGNCTVNQGGYGIVSANYGSSTNGWHGPALKRNIETNLDEFEIVAFMEHNSDGRMGLGSNATDKPANNSTFTCTANPSLRIRKDRATNSAKVGSIPKGKDVNVTEISKGWGKVTYGGTTGYSCMDYLTLKSNKNTYRSIEEESAENRLGRIELYGFDSNGQKLFKFVLRDSEQWFEYTEPEVFIGNTLVLSDNKSAPKPKTETVQDYNNKAIVKEVDSGKFGDWNEFYGSFILRRSKLSNGQYQWYAEVNKTVDGKVVNSIKTNMLSNDAYPKGLLNHVIIWFGQYKDSIPVDTMGLTNLTVRRINKLPDISTNQKIFKAGEEVIIDCREHKIYSIGKDYMKYLDIGSEFFDVRDGVSEIKCISDDKNIDVEASIIEKWL
ncbi:distal tail protein Dit [Romboutsia sp.]|uniref:distal tail protein Dit n=1 Tax=Romboutsia sp. TaxID=1965302 RepID=UPI003F329408